MLVRKRLKALTIIDYRRSTYLINHNKCIWLWLKYLVYISNTTFVRNSRLVDSINIALLNKKYNPAKALIDLDNLKESESKEINSQLTEISLIAATSTSVTTFA